MRKSIIIVTSVVIILLIMILCSCSAKKDTTLIENDNSTKSIAASSTNMNEGKNKSRVKADLITRSLEYDELPSYWNSLDTGEAEVTAYYGYFKVKNTNDSPDAAIYAELFDGEKRYNTESGIKERLQGLHEGEKIKDLTIRKLSQGIFDYSYSFGTESDKRTYLGYIFEEKDVTWEVGYYDKESLGDTTRGKLEKDFSNMVESAKIVPKEGDIE